jgi:hypothetical protein
MDETPAVMLWDSGGPVLLLAGYLALAVLLCCWPAGAAIAASIRKKTARVGGGLPSGADQAGEPIWAIAAS